MCPDCYDYTAAVLFNAYEAVLCQQARHEQHHWQRGVKDGAIGQHAKSPATEGILVETSCTGAPQLPGSPVMSAPLPV